MNKASYGIWSMSGDRQTLSYRGRVLLPGLSRSEISYNVLRNFCDSRMLDAECWILHPMTSLFSDDLIGGF
jgi:hypothetical protein